MNAAAMLQLEQVPCRPQQDGKRAKPPVRSEMKPAALPQ
jgi:hypothetical protein